jgi:hypothetical protein
MNGQSIEPNGSDDVRDRPRRKPVRPTVLQRILFLLAVVVGTVLGAVGWAAATGDSPTPQPSVSASTPATDHPSGAGWGGPWGGRWGGALFDRSRALHGEVVVTKDEGGTETVVIQRGELTTVTGTSIAVTSSDGFHQTYVTNEATTLIDGDRGATRSLERGMNVVVSALKSDSTLTAMHIIHLTN